MTPPRSRFICALCRGPVSTQPSDRLHCGQCGCARYVPRVPLLFVITETDRVFLRSLRIATSSLIITDPEHEL